MKIIKLMLLAASLLAIAGAAVFQLFVLLTSMLSKQPAYNRHTLKAG